jgi:hypothetical protein
VYVRSVPAEDADVARLSARVGFVGAVLTLAACGSAFQEAAPERPRHDTTRTSTISRSVPTSDASTSSTSTTLATPTRALHKVLLLGDSEMFDASGPAAAAFKAAGIETNSQAFPGTSLLGGTSVTQTFPSVLAEQDPDAVVLLYTGVYFPPLPKTFDGRDVLLGTPEFWAAWGDAAENVTRELSATGALVYWVLLPHNHITWAEHDTRLNDTYLSIRDEVPNVQFVDWRNTVVSAPDGGPLDMAPIGPDGAIGPVRGPDGAHFSADASRVLGEVLANTVLADYGLR